MSYKVQYSAEARQDLRDIFNYIAQELLVSDTAKNQTRRIMDAVKSLDEMPMRHSLYRDAGKLMISVLSAVAEIERENILVQTMEGRRQKARTEWEEKYEPFGR